MDTDAFALYFILWVLHADSPASYERKLNLLTLCAGTASSFDDLELIQSLLLSEICKVEDLGNTEIEKFLLRTVLGVVYKKMNESHALEDQLWASKNTFYDLGTFLTSYERE
jgi:hypothetical protein